MSLAPSNTGRLATLLLLAIVSLSAAAAEMSEIQRQLEELRLQNRQLQEQIQQQQQVIESLHQRLEKVAEAEEQRDFTLRSIQEELEYQPGFTEKLRRPLTGRGIHVSGTAAAGIYHTGSDGAFPHAEFRVDEARLFVDAEVWDHVYAFAEVNLITRERDPFNENVQLGEFYIDFENVSRFFDRERWINVRVGRFYIPFGEEYQVRYAIHNPLISHSLSDFWGVDEGIGAYGSLGPFRYAAAVQNGGVSMLRDYHADKSVAGRLSYEPVRWLYVSVSGMRTGTLTVVGDRMSEMWFGDGFIRAIGPAATRFHAEIFKGNVHFLAPRGHLKLAGGYLHFDDNDLTADFSRDIFFYYVEGVHDLVGNLYAATRFSHIMAEDGAPIVGWGPFGKYFFSNANLTEEIWRLSMGLGYRWSRNLILKAEYTYEEGRVIGGRTRRTDFLGAEIAVAF